MNSIHDPPPAAAPAPDRWQVGFWSLFTTQFQGAFSDNAFKFLVTFMVMGLGFTIEQRDQLAPVVGAVFALPFMLFSLSAGYLCDRFSKRTVAIGTKILEVAIMILAVTGLAFHAVPLLIAVVFLLSTQSAFFGPAKYGLLPEMLPEKKLSWGNGLLSLGTFVAIITGTVVAGQLSEWFQDRQVWSGVVLLGLAGLGLICSLGIPRVRPADPGRRFQWNLYAQFRAQWKVIRRDRVLTLAVLGDAYFWHLAALLQLTILFYGKDILQLGDAQVSYLMAALAIGIGAGSGAAGFLSGQKIEYGLVPLGALGLTVMTGLLSLPGLTFAQVLFLLGVLGFFGGFYIVPLAALVQHRPDPRHKGSVIATLAVLSFSGVFLASCVYYALTQWLGMNLLQIFLYASVMTLLGTVFVVRLLPDSLLRLVLWMLTHSLYRITVQGRDHLPAKGGALLVCNHLSWADALFILASTDRHVRFLMDREMYELAWIRPLARILKVIPIDARLHPRRLLESLHTARAAVQQGEVVCIFAEGQITRTGQMLPFHRGLEKIMKGVEAPIIPVCLDGVWGSIFSFEQGRLLWKWPRRIPYPLTVCYGEPLPSDSRAAEVRRQVQQLGSAAWPQRRRRMQTLHRSFVRTARAQRRRPALADADTPALTWGAALVRVVLIARRLAPWARDQDKVALLLPPCVPAALVNLAVLLTGRIPVNLNYTLSTEGLASCLDQCQLDTILTSRAFLKNLPQSPAANLVCLEDLLSRPGRTEKVAAWLLARWCPARWLESILSRGRRAGLDDVATIIFSSGSTGTPKGVVLSHYNIASNVEQLAQVFALGRDDRMLGVLPFFHSFGFTGTLSLPVILGLAVVYHPNPLDARTLGSLAQTHRITYLLATPTFLQLYLRGCQPEQLQHLRFVMVGAEKLPGRLADAFEQRFGVRPLEAYGCTECAPAVAVNTPDRPAPGLRQVGSKPGTIGHPLPGISVRIVDPDTRQDLPLGQPGLLLVKGPNVMQGYLDRPEESARAFQDEWYVTGDIAALDEDGFLTITDRLSRFSKIGGEMVPHIKVEDHLHELAGLTEKTFVVTGLPDEKKGEKLAVLHRLAPAELERVLEKLRASDLPNLWKPRRDQFFQVEAFPLLGSGKIDLPSVRRRAAELAGPAPSPPA